MAGERGCGDEGGSGDLDTGTPPGESAGDVVDGSGRGTENGAGGGRPGGGFPVGGHDLQRPAFAFAAYSAVSAGGGGVFVGGVGV